MQYPVLIFSSTKHDHAPQADEAMSSGDEEHDFNTGHVPIGQSPEDFPPAIQKNIIEMGSYIVSHLCHPTMINLYLPARPQQEQLYMFRSHLTIRTLEKTSDLN